MTESIQRIGILTGGGDCPGLNAAIRGLGKSGMYQHNWDIVGIRDGYKGLVENRVTPLGLDELSGILTRGGTILGTNNRVSPDRYLEGMDESGEPIFTDAIDR